MLCRREKTEKKKTEETKRIPAVQKKVLGCSTGRDAHKNSSDTPLLTVYLVSIFETQAGGGILKSSTKNLNMIHTDLFRKFLPEIPPHLFAFQYDLFRRKSGDLFYFMFVVRPWNRCHHAIAVLLITAVLLTPATTMPRSLCASTADRKVYKASMIRT